MSWNDALSRTSKAIKETDPSRSFYYLSGRSSNEAGFLLQLAARVHGTNNINNCSYYCHQASGVGLTSVTGSGTATVVLEDLHQCDLVFLIGCNPASNHPRLIKTLVDVRRRGGKVIVVNPMMEQGLCKFRVPSDIRSLLFGSKISDIYIQPHIGGDSAFLLGVIKSLGETEDFDKQFIEEHAEGFEAIASRAAETPWSLIVEQSGVAQETIEKVSSVYVESAGTIFCWAMGITHVKGGVDGVRMIANTAIARGMIGRKGAGLLPLRGHSNVQGMGTVGVVPSLKGKMVEAIERELNITLPKEDTGFRGDTMACMQASHRGELDYAMCLGGNLLGSNPDTRFAIDAMSKIQFVSYMSTTLNSGHLLGRGIGTVVLPVLARDEEEQLTTQESMFNVVRRSSGGVRRHSGPRSEVSIIAELAHTAVCGIQWEQFQNHDSIRRLIAQCVDGFDAEEEHQIKGRTFHTPTFATNSGKAIAYDVTLKPQRVLGERELRLMTIRSEGQFNTVVYEEEDVYRNQTRRDIVLLHLDDIVEFGLDENEAVIVRGDAGELQVTVRRFDIKRGNCAMYFPEANVLLSTEVDDESKTPLFKGAIVELFRRVDT